MVAVFYELLDKFKDSASEGDGEGSDHDGNGQYDENGTEEVEWTANFINKDKTDNKSDGGGKSGIEVFRQVEVVCENGENHHTNSDDDASGDGIMFDVVDEFVFDAFCIVL